MFEKLITVYTVTTFNDNSLLQNTDSAFPQLPHHGRTSDVIITVIISSLCCSNLNLLDRVYTDNIIPALNAELMYTLTDRSLHAHGSSDHHFLLFKSPAQRFDLCPLNTILYRF